MSYFKVRLVARFGFKHGFNKTKPIKYLERNNNN